MLILWLITTAHGAGSCETTCARIASCLGDLQGSILNECRTNCASAGISQLAHDTVLTAGTCEEALLALALAGASSTPGPSPATAPVPAPTQPAAPAPPGGTCRKPQAEADVVRLMTASPWCTYEYSGSTERQSRWVLTPDGRVQGTEGSETVRTGQNANQYGDVTQNFGAWGAQSDRVQACCDVIDQKLALSTGGSAYAAMTTVVSQNSNGYPILTLNGKEYFQCN